MQVSIIIVSYNVRHYLRQCLQSVWQSAQSAGLEVEVFVVDNHSTDDSIAHLRQHFGAYEQGRMPKARLHLIANKVNVGFGRANNQALKRCTGKYVLFLNPDTIVTERTLADCWAEAERHERLGAMGVTMLHTNGRFAHESRRGLPTPWTAFCKMSGLARLFPRSKTFGHYYMRYLDENEAHSIEIVSGAFMWCSHQALKECGGFDEQFFMYGEDIDLSYRFLLAGYDNRYLPTPILHYKGESTQKNTYKYVHVFYEAMLIFFKKHFPTSSAFLSLPVTAAIYVQAFATLLRQNFLALGRYLWPNRYRMPTTMLYIGPQHTFAALREKSETWGITPTCVEQMPTSLKAAVVAFSAEHHSYESILQQLQQSDHSAHLGIYYPSTECLVMGSNILT